MQKIFNFFPLTVYKSTLSLSENEKNEMIEEVRLMEKKSKNLDYKSLEISNGGLASSSYKKLRGQTDKEITHTREELFKYCRLDTFAMYEIYRKLLSL